MTPRTAVLLFVPSIALSAGAGCRSDLLMPPLDGGDAGADLALAIPDGGAADLAIATPRDLSIPADLANPANVVDLATALRECPEPGQPIPLEPLRKAVVGTWRGTATSRFEAPYAVEITFRANNNYSARALGTSTPAFYYGDDVDSPRKTYLLTNIRANGDGDGDIEIGWDNGASTTRGALERVRACRDGGIDRLSFEFWNTWTGRVGPFQYVLARIGP